MTFLLAAELSAACSSLGFYDRSTNEYHADDNVLETLKDLIRYLRRDEDTRDVRRQLGETNILVVDLLPIFKNYWSQNELFDVLLRLLVNLTTPPLILWNEVVPTDKIMRNYYLQIEGHLQRYKEAFTDDSVWAILSTKLSKILELEYADRGEENGLVIERILILIRNVLYVPSDRDSENRPDNDANLHDQVLWALKQSGMLDIVLYMASSTAEHTYYLHIIELLSFLLREQSPQILINCALERNRAEKRLDESQLLRVRQQENSKKKEKLRQYTSARHSNFGGTFVVQSMKAIGDNYLIYHKPLSSLEKLDFDAHKPKLKTPKNKLPIREAKIERYSAFSIRLLLKEFCTEFLNGAYNTFMLHVKRVLVRAGADTQDESYYFWALRFFMEFNRLYKCEVKLVSETMSKESFHYVQQRMEHNFDMIQSDKLKLFVWSKRLHMALLAYRELLLTLSAMDNLDDDLVVESARIIKCNLFYVIEYRELILTLLITFDELKMSDLYLKDLIETQHVFLKLLEAFCKQTGGVVVAERKKSKQKKKKANKSTAPTATPQDLWNEISSDLAAVLASHDPLPEVVPVDFTVPQEEQKPEAMKNIQRKLRNNELETAVALLRACREVWPENDTFGKNPSPPEEEYLIFQEIFYADLGEAFPQLENVTHEDSEQEDDENENSDVDYSETTLKFEDFTKRLSHPKIVRAAGLCLQNFMNNSVFTNHCTIKLIYRIAFGCKMYCMFFQVSIFRTFQSIFAMKDVPQYKEMVKIATHILCRFFKIAQTNPKVYIEVLFWKTCKDAVDIEHGYGSYHKKVTSAKVWSEEEENELSTLYEEYFNKHIEDDLVDWITNNLVDNTKSRRLVLKKLTELGLAAGYKPRKSTQKRNHTWTAAEETELRELFETFRNTDDPLESIMANLSINKPKNRIVEKLLVMGLISDRSEIRKKRKKKSKGTLAVDDDSISDDGVPSSQQSAQIPIVTKKETLTPAKTKSGKLKRKMSQVSFIEIRKLLGELMEKGFEESLNWLAECFIIAADDLENASDLEEEEGIPLVPLMGYAENALEYDLFKKLLLVFGMWEPTDERVYWRIPNSTKPAALKNYIDLISNFVARSTIVDQVEETAAADDENEHSSVDRSDSKNEQEKTRNSDDESGNKDAQGSPSQKHKMYASQKRKKFTIDSSEDEVNNPFEASASKGNTHEAEFEGKTAIFDSSEDESTTRGENESKRPRESFGTEIKSPEPQKKKKRAAVVSSEDE